MNRIRQQTINPTRRKLFQAQPGGGALFAGAKGVLHRGSDDMPFTIDPPDGCFPPECCRDCAD